MTLGILLVGAWASGVAVMLVRQFCTGAFVTEEIAEHDGSPLPPPVAAASAACLTPLLSPMTPATLIEHAA